MDLAIERGLRNNERSHEYKADKKADEWMQK